MWENRDLLIVFERAICIDIFAEIFLYIVCSDTSHIPSSTIKLLT